MRRSEAVTAVTGVIFEEGWSRIRGSMQGLHQTRQQMARAARGHRAAVFKAIRGGGTHTKSQLRAQLAYLTTKSSYIVDSRGTELDGKRRLDADEINSVVDRFAKRWHEGFQPTLGQTTHLLMSFPIGTRGADVRDISAAVVERFFQTEAGTFDYIIAVHEDRAHPHAHIVLNRRSQEGELFYLGRDHRFNYDDFRLAMVEEAERLGVRLEATRRLQRGIANYPARTREVYAARDDDRLALGRARIGADLDRSLAEIAAHAGVYRSLAAEATADNRHDIETAFLAASAILAGHGRLEPTGDIYMATERSFDDLSGRFTRQIERVSQLIEAAPEGRKAALERQLTEALAPIAHLQPLGPGSARLREPPSATGVYSERNIDAGILDRLDAAELRAEVETALRGTGISPAAVVDRIGQGANSAALERLWYAGDLATIAATRGLNLERRNDLRLAADALDQAHVRLGIALERADVLRRDGVVEDSEIATFHHDPDSVDALSRAMRQELRDRGLSEAEIAERADAIETGAESRIEAEQRAWLARHPELLARPGDVLESDAALGVRVVDQGRAEAIDREIERITARSDGRTQLEVAIATDFAERYPDMPDHLARGLAATYVAAFSANNRDALIEAERQALRDAAPRYVVSHERAARAETARIDRERTPEAARLGASDPELRRVIAHERTDRINAPFATEAEGAAFRERLERALGEARVERLTGGDADALDQLIEDRLERLYAAKAWLQADARTASSDGLRAVVTEINDREFEAERLRSLASHSEKGLTHG